VAVILKKYEVDLESGINRLRSMSLVDRISVYKQIVVYINNFEKHTAHILEDVKP
jgi:hypothetical protein